MGGSLRAVGTPRDPTTFTSAEALPGYWKGLHVLSTSAANELQHVVLGYGGSSPFNGNEDSDGGLFVEGTMRVSDREIAESGGHGVVVGAVLYQQPRARRLRAPAGLVSVPVGIAWRRTGAPGSPPVA